MSCPHQGHAGTWGEGLFAFPLDHVKANELSGLDLGASAGPAFPLPLK